MAWIQTIEDGEARGRLARSYASARERAGHVHGIQRSMSLAPGIMDASMGLYQRIMFAEPGLTRSQREMLAVVVSQINECHY